MLFLCLPSQMSVGKCWHLICHQQQSTPLFFLNHHHLRHCITTFTHGHHRPQHSSTAHNDHSTLQHNNNPAMPHHQPNKCRWGQHDAMSIIWWWWHATSSPSGCFQPPWWVNNHLAPPLLIIQVPCHKQRWGPTYHMNSDEGPPPMNGDEDHQPRL